MNAHKVNAKSLSEVCDFQNGFAFKSKTFREEGIPVIRISNIQNECIDMKNIVYVNPTEYNEDLSKYSVQEGDLLIAMSGATTGKLGISNSSEKLLLNQRVGKFMPRKGLDQKYLYYFLSTKVEESLRIAAGAAQPNLSTQQIKDFRIPTPPLPEQERIVAKLDKAFAAIDQANANVQRNQQNAKELKKSFRSNLYQKKTKGSPMVEFESVVNLTRGHNPPKSQFIYEPKDGYVRFFQIRDGSSDKYKVYVPDNGKLHKVEEDEILMVAYRHVGRAFKGANGAFNVALCKITNSSRDRLNDDYLFDLIPSDYIRGELLKESERSLIPSMSVKHLAKLKIPLPALNIQEELIKDLHRFTEKQSEANSKYEAKLNNLEDLKKSLLERAFKGELS